MKQVIIVLGMHRSGTSAVTRGLKVFGVDVGKDLLPPAEDNTKGFWEHRGINQLNMELLDRLGVMWSSLRPELLEDAEHRGAEQRELLDSYKETAKNVLAEHIRQNTIFGFKDPRVCRLLPFWQEVCAALDVQDKYVICLRHPMSVAASLEKRNAFRRAQSYVMWIEHLLPAVDLTKDKPRVVVDYDLLLQNPAREIERMGKALDLTPLEDELALFSKDFLDPGMNHAVYGPEDLQGDPEAVYPLKEFYESMLQVARDALSLDDRNFQRRCKRYAAKLREYGPLLEVADVYQGAKYHQENETIRIVGERDKHIEGLDNHINALEINNHRYQERVEQLDAALEMRNAQINELNAQKLRILNEREQMALHLNCQLAAFEQLVDQIHASTSWRITAPLRFAGRLARNPRQALSNPRELVYGTLRFGYHAMPLPHKVKRPIADGLRKGHSGLRLMRYMIRDKGGMTALLRLVAHYWREEGWQGLAKRFTMAFQRESFNYSDLASALRIRGAEVLRRAQSVDIVICVHNALEDVRRCLNSVLQYTYPPYRLIVVDDGSAEETRDFLRAFMAGQPGQLIRNEKALGYTHAANIGMRASTAPFVVLLNSDTIVSSRWLDRMVQCMESDPQIGLAGPLSNTASWQSVPEVFGQCGEDWNCNDLPQGWSVDDMAAAVAAVSTRSYPVVGFLNGFCMMLRQTLFENVGYFDEETFVGGFGEENDYCLRVGAAGWKLAVADDCYIYHAQSKSYSHERRKELVARSDAALIGKHSQQTIIDALDITKDHPVLLCMRARAALFEERERLIRQCHERFQGKSVLFLLFAANSGGGSNIILREAQALRRCGVEVHIANQIEFKDVFERFHPHIDLPVIYFNSRNNLLHIAERYDAVVSSLFLTVDWLTQLQPRAEEGTLQLGYYVQDYEPHFFDKTDPLHVQALESYTKVRPMHILTKTRWNQTELMRHTQVDATPVGPSYDWDLFFPTRNKLHTRPVVVTAMVRPSTPRRNPALTMRVLRILKERYEDRIDVVIFGCRDNDPDFAALETNFAFTCHGELPPGHVAELLDRSHVFLDLSSYQAMGLTALEAMACGVAVVGPQKGGLGEIITHGVNGLLVDTDNEQACIDAASRLIEDQWFRADLQKAAIGSAVRHYPERAAANILNVLFGNAETA